MKYQVDEKTCTPYQANKGWKVHHATAP